MEIIYKLRNRNISILNLVFVNSENSLKYGSYRVSQWHVQYGTYVYVQWE